MATTEAVGVHQQQSHDRPGRRRPFSTWMKKLANFKGSSSADGNHASTSKRNGYQMKPHSKKLTPSKNNSPYMTSGPLNASSTAPVNGQRSFSTVPTGHSGSASSLSRSRPSFQSSVDGLAPPTIGNRSNAPTMSTEPDLAHSEAAQSHGASSGNGTTATVSGGGPGNGRGADSTFSSPSPSLRSLTTTLTTVHSTAAVPIGTGNTTSIPHGNHGTNGMHPHSIQFTHQFPSSPPPTALPAHLAPQGSGGHPLTYSTATANNLLTDNASILTLASSSKRRRRRSMDTDASVRALAPSSLFGGSRESLPLSLLSANVDQTGVVTSPGLHQARQSAGGPNERASIYSATGIAPALPSERNSYYAGKQNILGDGGSIKSGLLGHGRTDSITGSIGGIATTGSPLASPREQVQSPAGRVSRSNSGWGETGDDSNDTDKVAELEKKKS